MNVFKLVARCCLFVLIIMMVALVLKEPGSKSSKISLKPVGFSQLPGWGKRPLKKSWLALEKTCHAYAHQDDDKNIGTAWVSLKVADIKPICLAAAQQTDLSQQAIKSFFEHWFEPWQFQDKKPLSGLFTGYYTPLLHGSRHPSSQYSVPLYEKPKDLITVDLGRFNQNWQYHYVYGRKKEQHLVPYYTRAEIDKGILKDTPVVAYLDDKLMRYALELEGSGVIVLDNGEKIYVGYDGQNGAPFRALAGLLIRDGVMSQNEASMKKIKEYFTHHPNKLDYYLHQNPSFVFFHEKQESGVVGSMGVVLTDGYSMAIDKQYIPMGMPLWIDTKIYSKQNQSLKSFQRLMLAQDVGGAIKGAVRGDIYFGAGRKAAFHAGHMKQAGLWWVLLPKRTLTGA